MKIFQYQIWHLIVLLALLAGAWIFARESPVFPDSSFFGLAPLTWYIIALICPIIHQLYVVICWRAELYYHSLSHTFGDRAFAIFKIGFGILLGSRLISILGLAIATLGTLDVRLSIGFVLSLLLLLPIVYLLYSVSRFFGIDRAFGIDHFQAREFKHAPMEKRGIFRFTSNGMYIYGFLILYLPALLLQSLPALIVAVFNHLYIWAHYFFTEKPDMRFIYGSLKK